MILDKLFGFIEKLAHGLVKQTRKEHEHEHEHEHEVAERPLELA